MPTREVIDINLDYQTRRQRLKRRILRVIIPLGCVILIVAAIAATFLFSYSNNRREALALSQDMLDALDRRIHSELAAYLLPASNLVRIGAETAREYIDQIWSPSRTPTGLQIIKTYPQLSNFFVGNPQGNFVMHTKDPDGTIDTKVIERKASMVKVTWISRDAAGNVVDTETSGDDDYDPRVRSWYKGAVQTRSLYWTDVYIFFADKKPGITVSYPMFSQKDQLLAVIGIDIKLEKLSEFLANLKIGSNGRAMIIDGKGTLVAYPEMERTFKRSGGTLETVMLDEIGDPVLSRAFNRFKIDGHGRRVLEVEDRRYLNTITSLESTVGRDWSVMILVPEEDFVGFLRDDLRKVLLMTIVIVIITGILAVLLVYQGLRADRNAMLVLARKEEIESQSRAFSELASKTALWDPEDSQSLEELTEIVSLAMKVRRASVWGYHEDEKILKCEDSFDRGTNGHTRGTVIKFDDYPQLLQDLINGEDIIIADTAADPRTSELHRVYLEPLGCISLLAIPVMPGSKTAGAIWFENEETVRVWNSEDISFARSIAGMLGLRLAATVARGEVVRPDKDSNMNVDLDDRKTGFAGAPTTSASDKPDSDETARPERNYGRQRDNGRKIGFAERMQNRGLEPSSIKADLYENVTVLVLRFTDPFALAEYLGGDNPVTVVDHFICDFEDLFDARRIDHWKIVGDQIVCAAGMQNTSNHHIHAIADLALSFQDKCSHLFADLDKAMEFKIGIDTGRVIGSPIGRRQKSYNIWGEAVSTASMMANNGVTGGIQVSETTYRRLQENYLFRVRGRYYLPNIGEISTYLLTGRM